MSKLIKISILITFLLVLNSTLFPHEIHEAVQKGDIEKIKNLVNNSKELVNLKTERGISPLHYAVYLGKKEIAGLLIKLGADVKILDRFGNSPIFWAVHSGKKGCIQLLVDAGADINQLNASGYSTLHAACKDGKKESAAFLLTKGANVMLKSGDGLTAIHFAAINGSKEIIELLIQSGIDVNALDINNDTPLHGAVWEGHDTVASFLLTKGAEVNSRNRKGFTPLDNAIIRGFTETVSLLKAKGAKTGTGKYRVGKKDTISEANRQEVINDLTFTILYDNYVAQKGTRGAWGFSCLIQGAEKTILFDTGGKGDVLMENIQCLKVDLQPVDLIAISHNHWDHTGGLNAVLKKKANVTVYFPASFPYDFVRNIEGKGAIVKTVLEPEKLCKGVYSCGEMGDRFKEQSLVLNTPKGLVIVTGCSHPGIVDIVRKAKEMMKKKVYFVFGGFHLMRHSDEQVKKIIADFRELGVEKCGATHCTGDRQIKLFKEAYAENYVKIGSGRILKITPKGLE